MKRTLACLALSIALPLAAEPQVERNSLGMAFVKIAAGEFMMGSEEDPAELARAFPALPAERFAKLGDEGPVHRVRITSHTTVRQAARKASVMLVLTAKCTSARRRRPSADR